MSSFGLTAYPSNEELRVPSDVPRILFFDFGTKLGWAFGVAGRPPVSGSLHVSKDGQTPKGGGLSNQQKFGNALRMAEEMFDAFRPTAMGWESPYAAGAGKGMTTTANVEIEWGLPAIFVGTFYNRGVYNFQRAAPQTIRKHFIGQGRPPDPKPIVFRKCVALRWINPNDDGICHDRSDALAGWSWAETFWAAKLAQPTDDLLITANSRR